MTASDLGSGPVRSLFSCRNSLLCPQKFPVPMRHLRPAEGQKHWFLALIPPSDRARPLKFPVNFPVSREFTVENSSRRTAPTASEAANLLSRGRCAASEAHFTGAFARKSTTMRRTKRLSDRPFEGLPGPFLRAMIVEWLFPMHFDRTMARLQRTVLLEADLTNSHAP